LAKIAETCDHNIDHGKTGKSTKRKQNPLKIEYVQLSNSVKWRADEKERHKGSLTKRKKNCQIVAHGLFRNGVFD
jgi:hypothetical protein